MVCHKSNRSTFWRLLVQWRRKQKAVNMYTHNDCPSVRQPLWSALLRAEPKPSTDRKARRFIWHFLHRFTNGFTWTNKQTRLRFRPFSTERYKTRPLAAPRVWAQVKPGQKFDAFLLILVPLPSHSAACVCLSVCLMHTFHCSGYPTWNLTLIQRSGVQ